MILIFQRCLVHYRAAFLKLLNDEFASVVCFGRKGPPISHHLVATADFAHCEISEWYIFPKRNEMVIQGVIHPLLKFKPKIVIIDPGLSILSNWIILFLKYFLRYKLILWGHGYNRKIGFNPEVNFSDKLRLWWMNRADAIISYSQNTKKMFDGYIRKPDKIFVAGNTLDTKQLTKIRDGLEEAGRENIKGELGFKEKYNIIYSGRILREKEPDRLIDVFRLISQRMNNVALQIVGDGPFLNELKIKSEGLKIKFWGGVTDERITGKLLFASDIMVMPGYLGLSVVHSFCFDLPVVSQKQGNQGPFHSPEIEYVIDGKTGFLIEYGDNQCMAEKIIHYLTDQGLQINMKKEIRKIINEVCSIDNMIRGFREALCYVEGKG